MIETINMVEPKKLRLKHLIDEIVSKEGKIPILEAIVEVYGDKKPDYKIRLNNYKERLSILYGEIDRRDKLYSS